MSQLALLLISFDDFININKLGTHEVTSISFQNSTSFDDTQTLVDYLELNLPKDILNSAILDSPSDNKKLLESNRGDWIRSTRSDSDINNVDDYYYNSVTGTPKPPNLLLNDIFISVKTTKNYHDNRLALIIKTWFQLAKDQVGLFAIVTFAAFLRTCSIIIRHCMPCTFDLLSFTQYIYLRCYCSCSSSYKHGVKRRKIHRNYLLFLLWCSTCVLVLYFTARFAHSFIVLPSSRPID